MKSNLSAVRLLFVTAAVVTFASFAYAGPGPQYWTTLHDEAQFKQLKPGDKIALVCNQCKTVSEIPITSPEQAMGLCKEGATVMCPSCKKESKVVMKRSRNDSPTHTEVVYVNDKGEECAFMTMVAESK